MLKIIDLSKLEEETTFLFHIKRWYYRWRFRLFGCRKIKFPIVKNISQEFTVKDLIEIQPMAYPLESNTIKFICMDENNPNIGDIFIDSYKYSLTKPDKCCGCMRNGDDYWHKIWTKTGWVFEKQLTKEEWNNKII